MTNNDIPLNIYTQTFCWSLAPQTGPVSEYNYYDHHISTIILILYNIILLIYYCLFILNDNILKMNNRKLILKSAILKSENYYLSIKSQSANQKFYTQMPTAIRNRLSIKILISAFKVSEYNYIIRICKYLSIFIV